MPHQQGRVLSKQARYLSIIVVGVLIVLGVGAGEMLLNINSTKTTTSSAPPTVILATTRVVATSTRSVQATKMIPVKVSAYTLEGNMADGKQTHVGACAVSTEQFPLGTILDLYNTDGSFNRQCVAEDTGNNVHFGEIDLAMPGDSVGAIHWGIRNLWARVVRWGWGTAHSPTPLPTP